MTFVNAKLYFVCCIYVHVASGSHVKSNRADISMSANNDEETDSR